MGIFVCSEQASPHHWLELSETYSKGGMKAAEEWKSGRIAMKKYDKPQVCRVIGCTHTSNCGTEIEDKFGIVLCDPDPDLPVSTSHYVAFFEAEDREAWIEAHCRVRCECGRERNEDDYLCPMCRYSLYEQISE